MTTPPWKYVHPLSVPRLGLAAVTAAAPAPQSGSRIYAIGGADFAPAAISVLATVEAYDTSTNSWSNTPPIQPMHNARLTLAAASGPDGLHALGGMDASHTILTTHEIYEPATNAWSPAPSMPTARAGLAAATGRGPHGLIYAIGGYNIPAAAWQNQYLNTVDAYDPATGAWSSPPPTAMTTPRAFHAAVTGLDGVIYAIGGYNSDGQPVASVEAYYPSLDRWFSKPPLPTGLIGLAAAVDPKGLIYAIGGIDATNGAQPSVYSYNPADPSAKWTQQDSLLTASANLAAARGPDGLIYAIGGAGGSPSGTLSTVETYTPPDPCADIRAQIESFNAGDWQSPQAALAGFRALEFELIACEREHGAWPVIKG